MKLLAVFATVLLALPGPVAAQSGGGGGGLGGVLDTLGGILGVGGVRPHGNVVLVKGDTLVFRTDDGRTLSIDASGTDPRIRSLLKPGDGATVTVKQPREGGSSQALVASEVQLDPPSQKGKEWQRVEGTIQEARRSQVVFKTREGFVVPVDVSRITGLPSLTTGAPATLVYENTGQGVVGVWIEPGVATGAAPGIPGAAPGTPGAGGSASPATSPSSNAGELKRAHGLVESVRTGGFVLNTDDGRRLTIDTNRVSPGAPGNVREGDLVTVFGRAGDGPDAIIADVVQPDR